MRQLSALDTQFLNAESATTAAHVAGLAILDPAGGRLDRQALADLLLERLHLSPALSLRLVQVPLGLDRPYWAHDPDFDLDRHLFELTLPAPGGMRELADAVAEIHARRLDRAHPLWEMHLIHGLADGTVAVYTKVHHAAIDGVSGAETLATLLDLAPGRPDLLETPTSPETPDDVPDGADERHGEAGTDGDAGSDEAGRGDVGDTGAPSLLEMLSGAAVQAATQPVRTLRSMIRMAGELDAIPLAARVPGARLIAEAARVAGGDLEPRPEPPSLAVPRTPFNGPISAERRLAFGSVSYKDVRNVAKANDVRVNDVIMAVCASALRSWLLERDALPEEPLIVAVPVAVRTAAASARAGNQISALVTTLPTQVAGARERLRVAGETMSAAKRRFAMARTRWLDELCTLLPAPVAGLVTPAAFRLASVACPPINLIISNVPGPQFPLFLCGGRVLSYYPMSVLSDVSGGVNITCLSYDGMIDFGIVACPERMDDVWGLLGHLRTALDDLLDDRVGDEFRDVAEG
ncbi:wax ester/triacylglycerol synthase family O-acyltransferase [Nonomuraea glycinis]|uniref:wax ester/triacylglycerol synthase family O-acyltransferase n=1 Tax=Nonomuraea glycinis TaxID=2047744 RepID=UPI0033B41EEB